MYYSIDPGICYCAVIVYVICVYVSYVLFGRTVVRAYTSLLSLEFVCYV